MKYSAHKINVRSIRKMEVGETMLIKHGKRVEYKGGVTIAPKHYDGEMGWANADDIMRAARSWGKTFNDCKTTVIIIKCVEEGRYDGAIAEHYSVKGYDYNFLVNKLASHREVVL